MELNWSTFILEIINFLVLVWILKRFLYKPVQEIIARRREGIESTLVEAKSMQEEAKALQEQYEGRLADWDEERQQARDLLATELDKERAKRLAELQVTLAQEQEKMRVAETQRLRASREQMEKSALAQGGRFATRLLQQAAGIETESRLVELVIDQLSRLPEERIDALRKSWAKGIDEIIVRSVFPLNTELSQRFEQALHTITNAAVTIQYIQSQDLIAGVELTIGPWVLAANLRDELKGFIALTHEDEPG